MTASNLLPISAIAADPAIAKTQICNKLVEGSLALMLGAGVSVGMGLPPWHKLVTACLELASLPNAQISATSSADQLTRAINPIESSRSAHDYHNIIRTALYQSMRTDAELVSHPLLSAIGAMTMKSRRGSVSEVCTYNFDDVLERYLEMHGFVAQSILDPLTLRKETDVTIYHPYGFIPYDTTRRTNSRDVIFSKKSFDLLTGRRLDAQKELVRDLLIRKVVLFVGLSYNNGPLSGVLASIAIDTNIANERGPLGYWLVGANDDAETEEELKGYNIVPIRMGHQDYPQFILDICREAGNRLSN